MDKGEEVASRLLVACGDASKVLQLVEEAFDEVAALVEVGIEVAAVALAIGIHGDIGLSALALDEIDDPIDVVALVSEYDTTGDGLVEELVGRRHIMRLTRGERQP